MSLITAGIDIMAYNAMMHTSPDECHTLWPYYNRRLICHECRQEYEEIFIGGGNEAPNGEPIAIGVKKVNPEI